MGGAILAALAVSKFQTRLPIKAQNLFYIVLIGSFLVQQLIGARWTYATHWVFSRARLAQELVEKNELVAPIGSEEYFALGANAAAEVFNQKR